ncbi:MAG: hypothetical protein RIQ52_236 [Pseudomonadota bacterium]|jgi:hypothetical protein
MIGQGKLATRNFLWTLAALLSFLLLMPVLHVRYVSVERLEEVRFLVKFCFSLLMLSSCWTLNLNRQYFRLGVWLVLLSLLAETLMFVFPSFPLEAINYCLVLLFIIYSSFALGRHVFIHARVDINVILGSVCLYLLMGIFWATLYDALAIYGAQPAFQGMTQAVHGGVYFDELLYYSFITLTSVGYGDMLPLSPMVRVLAYLEAVAGQFYMAVLVAGLVGRYHIRSAADS